MTNKHHENMQFISRSSQFCGLAECTILGKDTPRNYGTIKHHSYEEDYYDIMKLRERHKERALTSRHSITKHLGKRMALFQIETTNLLESYNKSDHVRNHFNFLSKHDNGNSQM